MSNGWDSKTFSNISASTGAFRLAGGKYLLTCSATFNSGSVTFEALAADGSTWLTVGTAFSAAGTQVVDVGPGQYQFAIASATAVYASVSAAGQGA